jgi:cytochrome c oxidase assembly factor CtaG
MKNFSNRNLKHVEQVLNTFSNQLLMTHNFAAFIMHTIDASIAYLLSLSTFSTPFLFSSTGGDGIRKE